MPLNSKDNWYSPPSEVKDKYVSVCKEFMDDAKFKNFRRNPDYQIILEGNNLGMAVASMFSFEKTNGLEFLKENTKKFKRNDTVGNPKLIKGYKLSPSTLRYANVAWNIKNLLKDFKPKRIIEIGAGYGGLCRILSSLYDFDEYTIVDLPEAEKLTEKYLSYFPELKGKINFEVKGEYDLFIADASLAECNFQTQMDYANIANTCKFAYVLYNTLHIREIYDNFNSFLNCFNGYNVNMRNAYDENGKPMQSIIILSFSKP